MESPVDGGETAPPLLRRRAGRRSVVRLATRGIVFAFSTSTQGAVRSEIPGSLAMDAEKRDGWDQLHELIDEIRIGMLTTRTSEGVLRSRPMGVHQDEASRSLWFFTHADDAKTDEVRLDPQVNVAFSCPQINSYVSVSGTAELVRDQAKMRELWSPLYKAWFPEGLEDPEIALMRVSIEGAEYWDAPSGTMVQIVGFVKALVTGEAADDLGENVKLGDARRGERATHPK
jgi:general stress protein 26